MDIIGQIFGTILLFGIILIGFGLMTGVKVEGLVRTYLNLIVKIFMVIGEVLIKLAIPILKQLGEKIVYVSDHYLSEHKPQTPVIPSSTTNTFGSQQPTDTPPKNEPDNSAQKSQPSANPYDDPPKPEIMD